MTLTPAPSTSTLQRARQVDDLLGFVGHILGRIPRHSLAVITLRHRSLRAVIRVDLPPAVPTSHARRRDWCEAAAAAVRSDPHADGCLVLAIEPGHQLANHRELARPLRRALAAAHVPVMAAWSVCDGWAHAWTSPGEPIDVGSDATPVRVAHPELSNVSLALIAEGSMWNHGAEETVPCVTSRPLVWSCPQPDAEHPRGRAEWLAAWSAVLHGGPRPGWWDPAPGAASWDGDEETATSLYAWAQPLTHPAWRDALVATAVLGRVVESVTDGPGTDLYLARGEPGPDWSRLEALRAGLRAIAAQAPRPVAVEALAVAGWVSWARGQGSAAAAHVRAALDADPRHSLSRLLQQVVHGGVISDWAANPATAWRAHPCVGA